MAVANSLGAAVIAPVRLARAARLDVLIAAAAAPGRVEICKFCMRAARPNE